jgi:hypothetical protein
MRSASDYRKILLPLLLFSLAMALYCHTLAPTITWRHDGYDAGDLITAAYTLGIPHPTGYPTYMLLGRAFTLLPLGDVAYRMNLLSAFCASVTVALLHLTATLSIRPHRYAGIASTAAALLLATSRIFWSQALITEVYALQSLFFTVTLYLALLLGKRLLDTGTRPADCESILRILLLLTLAYGLSLGNHLTILFSAPFLIYQGALLFRTRLLTAPQWLQAVTTFLLGLAVYVYLPLRAGSEALPNWGNPQTPRGFIWLVSGGIYRHYILALPLAHWPRRLVAWAGLLGQQFGVGGTALGLIGIWTHFKRNPRQFAGLLFTLTLYSLYAVGYNVTDSYVYLLPVYVLFALWIAHGVQWFLETFVPVRNKWSRPIALLLSSLALLLPAALALTNLPEVDLSDDYAAYEYGSQVFAQAPAGSIVVSAADPHTFTLWYFARVVHDRCDIALIDRDLLPYDWYLDGLRRAYPWLQLSASLRAPISVEELLEAKRQIHPIFLTDPDTEMAQHYAFEQQGILYRLVEPTGSSP